MIIGVGQLLSRILLHLDLVLKLLHVDKESVYLGGPFNKHLTFELHSESSLLPIKSFLEPFVRYTTPRLK